jgi:hypothetical protein
MKYLKFTSYAYLAVALFSLYDGIMKWDDQAQGPWLSFGIAAVCVFMFFFRAKYSKRFEDRNSNQ